MQSNAADWCRAAVEEATTGTVSSTAEAKASAGVTPGPNSPQHSQAYAAYYQMYQNGAQPPMPPVVATGGSSSASPAAVYEHQPYQQQQQNYGVYQQQQQQQRHFPYQSQPPQYQPQHQHQHQYQYQQRLQQQQQSQYPQQSQAHAQAYGAGYGYSNNNSGVSTAAPNMYGSGSSYSASSPVMSVYAPPPPVFTAGGGTGGAGASAKRLTAPAPAPSVTAPAPVEWPAPLKRYVERCFAQAQTTSDRLATESYLKQLIGAVAAAGRTASHSWDTQQLPAADGYVVRFPSPAPVQTPSVGVGVVYANPNYKPPPQAQAQAQAQSPLVPAPAAPSAWGNRANTIALVRGTAGANGSVSTGAGTSAGIGLESNDFIPLSTGGTEVAKAPKRNRFSSVTGTGTATEVAAKARVEPQQQQGQQRSPYGPSGNDDDAVDMANNANTTTESKRKAKKALAVQLKREQYLAASAEAETSLTRAKGATKSNSISNSGSSGSSVLFTAVSGHQTLVSNAEVVNRAKRAQRFELDRLKLEAEKQEAASAAIVDLTGDGDRSSKRRRSRGHSIDFTGNSGAGVNIKTGMTEEEIRRLVVVGTCGRIEKEYFRLTSAPDPTTVRPQKILEQALAQLKTKWTASLELAVAASAAGSSVDTSSSTSTSANAAPAAAEAFILPTRQNAALAAQAKNLHPDRDSAGFGVDYTYMCSQLKAIRQDCTVQHIKNAFTIQVYEFHARVALQSADLNEYNQCQTQLKQLYALRLPARETSTTPASTTTGKAGSVKGTTAISTATASASAAASAGVSSPNANEPEFIAYRILYYVYLQFNKTSSHTVSNDVSALLASLSQDPSMLQSPAIQHALAVRKALTCGSASTYNYYRFFTRLYPQTPNLGRYILNRLLPQLRYYALVRLMKAFKPTLTVIYVLSQLGFYSYRSIDGGSSTISTDKNNSTGSCCIPQQGVREGVDFLQQAGVVFSLSEDGSAPSTNKDRRALTRLVASAVAPPPLSITAGGNDGKVTQQQQQQQQRHQQPLLSLFDQLYINMKDSIVRSDFLANSSEKLH